jgi:MoaA/NifB/PqqE/SkfB family radical SAM enzyme/ubiquinone/menaquinone biosynthesis C-methylase UbiE
MISSLIRREYEGVGIWFEPLKPNWFVPSKKGDFILQLLVSRKSEEEIIEQYASMFDLSPVTARLDFLTLTGALSNEKLESYKGRASVRETGPLTECWFHLTNNCNMECTHCMFPTGPSVTDSIDYDLLINTVKEIASEGCKVFYFTGGEPFIYNGFTDICDQIFRDPMAHIVVLTNGKNIKKFASWLDKVPKERLHLQISVDGMEENHDELRGKGEFERLKESLDFLNSMDSNVTLSMSVNINNIHEMKLLPDFAQNHGVSNIHFMWLFQKGRAKSSLYASPDLLFKGVVESWEKAQNIGVTIDNIEILRSQIFSVAGTRHDLSGSGWNSIAIDPNGDVYPSPALIGEQNLCAGNITNGVMNLFMESEVLKKIRGASLIDAPDYDPLGLGFLTGGGDIDHSYISTGSLTGGDPYISLYEQIIIYLIHEMYLDFSNSEALFSCRMGEYVCECSEDSSQVALTHSNCVLSLPGEDGYMTTKAFYSKAAASINKDILNPVSLNDGELSDLPQESQVSYGCGSPVDECNFKGGETLVDLGSGRGAECFLAAERVGSEGHVIGIDMLDSMLEISRESSKAVAKRLGYANCDFKKGFLEELPINSQSVDVVISNCVINLSPNKRKTFQEIFRILKPGGEVVVSDIISATEIPMDIKYNEKLRGECIGGAMKEEHLLSTVRDLGFTHISIKKRYLYRDVKGFPFYSLTWSAIKPGDMKVYNVIYRGPFQGVVTQEGEIVKKGVITTIQLPQNISPDDSFFVLDDAGNVTNIEQMISCGCDTPNIDININEKSQIVSESKTDNSIPFTTSSPSNHERKMVDCMVCSSTLKYLQTEESMPCHYCGKTFEANAHCEQDHFVCDKCHVGDGLAVIESICVNSTESDPIAIFNLVRSHPSIPIHGPEHHALVPACLVAAYKNSGGAVTNADILTAIKRGVTLPGGACGFMGVCGGSLGVGIAFSIFRKANPLLGNERRIVQKVTAMAGHALSQFSAARCCLRDSLLSIEKAIEASALWLDIPLKTKNIPTCTQHTLNRECFGKRCPYFPKL